MSPRARYRAVVDWDGDGAYNGTGEDVSGRVLARQPVRVRRGLDTDSGLARFRAGEAALKLNNASGDYSSLNSSGPLYGNLVTGRQCAIEAIPATDDFTRADSASSLGSADEGGAWTAHNGTWGIASNRAYCSAGSSSDKALATLSTSYADVAVEATIPTLPAGAGARIAVRATDLDNVWFAQVKTTEIVLRKREAGSLSDAGSWTGTVTTGDLIRVECYGLTLRVWHNGTLRVSYNGANGGSSFNSTATKHGIGVDNHASAGSIRFDNFRVIRPVLTGIVAALSEDPMPTERSASVSILSRIARISQWVPRGETSGYSTGVYLNYRVDELIGFVLDAIGMTDTALRRFDQANTRIAIWWLDSQKHPWDAISELVRAEGPTALFFEDMFGALVFKSRNSIYTDTKRSTSQATWRATGTEPVFRGDGYGLGRREDAVVNDISIKWVRRAGAATRTNVWERGARIELSPSETLSVECRHDTDPFRDAVTPALGTDYSVVAGSLSAAPALNRTSGQSVTLTMTAGAAGATVDSAAGDGTGMVIRAYLWPVVEERIVTPTSSLAASQAIHGKIPYPYAVWPATSGSGTMQHVVDMIADLYGSGRFVATIPMDNGSSASLVECLGRDIGDRVTVVDASRTYLNHEVHVLAASHSIRHAGGTSGAEGNHQTLFVVEEGPTIVTPFRLDTSQLGPTGTHGMIG